MTDTEQSKRIDYLSISQNKLNNLQVLHVPPDLI